MAEEPIVRTKTRVSGGVTEAEQVLLAEQAEKWIKNAFQTGRTDQEALTVAIKGLYQVSKLDEPVVVVVPSPFTMVTAGAIAGYLYAVLATEDAVKAGTKPEKNVGAALMKAVMPLVQACLKGVPGITDASSMATVIATAVSNAVAPRLHSVASIKAHLPVAVSREPVRQLQQTWSSFYQGGNAWSAYDGYLVAMRDVLGLDLPEYENYKYWEAAAKLGGFRYMHKDFCMVCDFPDVIKVDDQHRPHCDDGPSHKWSDGWTIWSVDGIAVDEQIVMRPETQTIQQINAEGNADVRAIRINRYGWVGYLRDSNAECIDTRDNEIEGTKEALYVTNNGETRLVATCATGRIFAMGVPSQITTCAAAQEYINGSEIKVVART